MEFISDSRITFLVSKVIKEICFFYSIFIHTIYNTVTPACIKMKLDNDTFENTVKSRFFRMTDKQVLY